MASEAIETSRKAAGLQFPLKDKQIETLSAALVGQDVLAALPTGYGKSLTFALLPTAWDTLNGHNPATSIVIVISPLELALMEQQLNKLNTLGIPAVHLGSPKNSPVDAELVSSIGRGLCVLIGINRNDNKKDMDFIVRKILNLRLFDDESGKRWSKSAKDLNLEILCVSQFTLYSVLKGNKPDFHLAMGGEASEAFYNDFLSAMRTAYTPEQIKDGKFGAYMQVEIQNDGPVTIEIESPPQEQNDSKCKGKQAPASKESGKKKSEPEVNSTDAATSASLANSVEENLKVS